MYVKSKLGSSKKVDFWQWPSREVVVSCWRSYRVLIVDRRRPSGEAVEDYCWKRYWRTLFKVKWTIRSVLRRYQDLL